MIPPEKIPVSKIFVLVAGGHLTSEQATEILCNADEVVRLRRDATLNGFLLFVLSAFVAAGLIAFSLKVAP